MESSISSNDTVDQSFYTEVPLGDKDKHLKIQICLEYLEKEKQTKSKSTKNILKPPNRQKVKVLHVTISNLKNVPKREGKTPNPFVKIRLMPDDIIYTTELKQDKTDAQYFETFEFPMEILTSKKLRVEVCDKKVTRRAVSFGEVDIALDKLVIGKPLDKWYELK